MPSFPRFLALPLFATIAACTVEKNLIDDENTGSTTGNPTTSTPTTSIDATGTSGGEPVDSCHAIRQVADTVRRHYCECDVKDGDYPDIATCLAELEKPADPKCECDVYAKDPQAIAANECYAAAYESFEACILAQGCDEDGFFQCEEQVAAKESECPLIPKPIRTEEKIQCEPWDLFMCVSGEQIASMFKCDQEPDCMDESDEMNCS